MWILDGSVPEPPKIIEAIKAANKKEVVHNSEYDSWVANDQQLLSCLLNSLTKEVLALVATTTTSAGAWKALEEMLSAHSKAQVTNLRMKLATLKKGSMTSSTYFTKMCSIKYELAAVGKVIDDDEMVHYILTGLDYEYNPFVSSVLGRVGSITLGGLYSQLLSYDMRLEMYQDGGQYQSSANAASRGRGGRGRGRGNHGRGNNHGGQNSGAIAAIKVPPNRSHPSAKFARRKDMKRPSAGTNTMNMRRMNSRTTRQQAQQPQTTAKTPIGMWIAAPLIMLLGN